MQIIDGNKRTGFAATITFLAINGAVLTADAEHTYSFIVERYESRTFDFAHLSAWLRANVNLA